MAAKELGAGERAQRIATGVAHMATAKATGLMINAALLDVAGMGATAGQAVAGGFIHSELHNPNGIFSTFAQPICTPS
jgi:hypothetical protein